MKKYLLIIAASLATGIGLAQNESDALRYTFLDFNGSARYSAMGGAFGALGGDLSAIYNNPAGIGLYRSGEVSLSPGFVLNNSNSTFNGTSTSDGKFNFNIGNIGLAFAIPGRKDSKIRFTQFGVNYNRLKDHHNYYTINGENATSSLSDVFADQAFGIPVSSFGDVQPFTGLLAWETFLIDQSAGTNVYESYVPNGLLEQTKTIETSGRVSETDLTFGINYDDRFYAGGSIGIQGISYKENSDHKEELLDTDLSDFEDFTYHEELETVGSGVNINLGVIYKLNEQLRIGGAWHSPKYYSLEDTWSTRITTNFEGGETYTENSIVGFNEYSLTTPSRFMGSAAYILGKKALVSADYEYVNYSKSKLKAIQNSPADFTDANKNISELYQATHNLRVGGEYRILPISIRAGAAYYDSPYLDGFTENKADLLIFTAGAGIKFGNNNYFDFAIKHSRTTSDFYLYDPSLVSAATLEHSNNTLRFTLGTKF
ncbi:MAG: hypothetical protein HKN39_04810 [Flavobacteriales bacterium]|nr:hypothetical protein [Flavobacteriales bacterium]